MEALKNFFNSIELDSSFWVGRWADIEKDPFNLQIEWTENGMTETGDCVIADVRKNFKWTRADCSISAAYLCKILTPSCPNGYSFVPDAGISSCFKITESVSFQDTSQIYPSISTANKMCLMDGTSLAAPGSKLEINALWNWMDYSFIKNHGKISGPEGNFKAFLGIRSFKESTVVEITSKLSDGLTFHY